MAGKSVEIRCTGCGKETLLRREPVYDGFKKTGERLFCASCGHEYASEDEVPFKVRPKQSVFTEADRPKKVEIFKGEEKGKNCRHCRHYVVNPFIQRCAIHHREVEATDVCARFEKKEEKEETEGEGKGGNPEAEK